MYKPSPGLLQQTADAEMVTRDKTTTLRVTVSDDVLARLEVEARKWKMTVQEYVQHIIWKELASGRKHV